MNTIEFTEGMNEVSGFGGFYERCCRAGVMAGARWCAAHPGTTPVFNELKGVFGLCFPEGDDAKALEAVICGAEVTRDDGTKSRLGDELTGAQFHAIAHHVQFIAANGWDTYVAQMSEPHHVYSEQDDMGTTNEPAV